LGGVTTGGFIISGRGYGITIGLVGTTIGLGWGVTIGGGDVGKIMGFGRGRG